MQVTLSAAKDRAQLTATTAMFLQNAAALKSLLDGGPEANRWDDLLWFSMSPVFFFQY